MQRQTHLQKVFRNQDAQYEMRIAAVIQKNEENFLGIVCWKRRKNDLKET